MRNRVSKGRIFAASGLLGAAAALGGWAWTLSQARAAEKTEQTEKVAKADRASLGAPAPDFSLTDQAGKPVRLADHAGKIIVLEWTNPDCPFVQRHYQEKTMTTLAEKYKDKGVVWIAIDSNNGETPDDIKKWGQDNHLAFPILNDARGVVAKAYDAKSTPDMFVIDKEGRLAYKGAIDNDPDGDKPADKVNYVQKAIDELLAGKSVSTPETKSYGCHVTQAD